MPIHFGTPMDDNPLGADSIVIFTATGIGFIRTLDDSRERLTPNVLKSPDYAAFCADPVE